MPRRLTRSTRSRLGRGTRLQRRADSDLGRAPLRSQKGRRKQNLLRRNHGRREKTRPRDDRALHPPAGTTRRCPSCLRRRVRRLRRSESAAIPRRARPGPSSKSISRESLGQSRPHTRTSHFPARSRGLTCIRGRSAPPDSSKPRSRTGEALAADPRRVRRSRHRSLLRNSPRRRPARWRQLRNVPRPCQKSSALQYFFRPEPLRPAAARLLAYIDIYHERIKMFHVKDAEFRPNGRQGVYGGFQPWMDRAGRFRSLGDGQVDFAAIFSKLTQYDFPAGPCSNGNAASKAPNRAPRKAPHSSRAISSRPPPQPSTISPPPAPTKPPTAKCSACVNVHLQPSASALGRNRGLKCSPGI